MKKGIETRNKLYEKNVFSWRSVRDALEGSDTVKRMNELYLPMPQGFVDDDSAPTSSVGTTPTLNQNENLSELVQGAPYYHTNPAYRAYLQRARFSEITLFTLKGLLGIATKKEMNIKLPSKIKYMEEKATKDGKSIQELYKYCLSETLSQGRVTLTVDVNQADNTCSIVPYASSSFLDWKTNEETGDTEFAKFCETETVFKDNSFEVEEQEVYFIYSIGAEGEVVLTKYSGDDEIDKTPSLQGSFFNSIPVVTIGSITNQNDPSPVPLFGISEIAYSMYRKDADLSQAEYMTCNPMFVITGADSEGGVPVMMGSTVALVLGNPDAKAFFTKTDTGALNHVQSAIEKLREEAATLGVSIIGAVKKAAEAAETTRIKQGSQSSTLIVTVDNVSKGIEVALKICAEISGVNPDQVSFSASTDFIERTLAPSMLKQLVVAMQLDAISHETVLETIIDSGLLTEGVTAEEELARISIQGPFANETGASYEEETEEEEEESESEESTGE